MFLSDTLCNFLFFCIIEIIIKRNPTKTNSEPKINNEDDVELFSQTASDGASGLYLILTILPSFGNIFLGRLYELG